MIAQVMVQPSIWVESGITIKKVRDVYLFKFSDALQARLDYLAERKKSDTLSAEEEAELTGLLELDRIFTLLNAKIIAESWASMRPYGRRYAREHNACVSTATRQRK